MKTTFYQSSVRLMIETKITMEDAERSQSIHKAIGTMYKKVGTTYLSYVDETDLGEVMNLVKISTKDVLITRRGAVTFRQRFVKGLETESVYKTAYGALRMITNTKEIAFSWNETRQLGSLLLVYELGLQASQMGLYRVNIQMEGVRE